MWNFQKDLRKLKQSFHMIGDFLEDVETQPVSDKSVQRWMMRLETLAFDAEYVFDQLNYQLLGNKTKKKVSTWFSTYNPISFRHKMARKIKKVKDEMKSINQEAVDLGLQMRIVSSHARGAETSAPPHLETDSFSEDPIFIGSENDVAKVMKMVTSSSPNEQLVSVLPIIGMGGLGKTTLTRKVYNDAKIISHFRKRIWVYVSQNSFDPLTVLKSIVASSTGENVDGSREVVLQKLHTSLGDKKYLLVLDNVWNEDRGKWENFMSSLKGVSSVKGSVVMVTTRNGNVANIVKTLDIHKLGILSEQDCWLIIKAKAFGGLGVLSTFESVGANIAKRCGGLPLAAQVVGGLLSGKSIEEWVSIDKTWLLSLGGDGNIVLELLKLSFNHLPSPSVKKCFSSYSIFRKGWGIGKNALIRLWMGEGLLQTDREIDMEIVGNKVLNILLQSSLLQVLKRDEYGDVKYCGMHDLVHDLASSILNSTFLHGSQQGRYMSRPLTDESSPISKEQAKCLRVLFFNGELSRNICSNLTRLHVLILIAVEMKELPNEIGKLISLRYLNIVQTRIKCLPDSISKLYLLHTIAAQKNLEKLPDTITFLINLRHLDIPNIKFPPKIGRLTSLQTLPYFRVGDEEGSRIMELESLKKLKGAIEIHNLEKVRDKEDAKTADLFHKTNILKLTRVG